MNEHGKSPQSKAKAQGGRDLRNEGRVEYGKARRPPSPAPVIKSNQRKTPLIFWTGAPFYSGIEAGVSSPGASASSSLLA